MRADNGLFHVGGGIDVTWILRVPHRVALLLVNRGCTCQVYGKGGVKEGSGADIPRRRPPKLLCPLLLLQHAGWHVRCVSERSRGCGLPEKCFTRVNSHQAARVMGM